ncbi:protein containing Nucleotidyltransferase domain [Clostridium sp. CAG:768]|nr:protein containing Nucleotidyltransferase domain [Clostridium sp. CAG:768]
MKNLDKFVEELKNTLGENLLSVIAFGSQANVEDAKSNLNLMIVTNELTAENLYDISKPVKKWVKGKNPIPVIMNRDEWYSSFDVYAIEYADIKENYRIIYGEDLIPTISINKYFLRLQCESELKSLLLKYKNNFLMNVKSDREMKKLLNNVIKTLLVIFRSVLRLHDSAVPYRAVDIIEFASNYLSFNKIVMSKIAKVRYENEDYTKQELLFIEAELVKDIQNILKQVDAMHF